MAMRGFGRAFDFAIAEGRLALIGLRALGLVTVLVAVLRVGDFFSAAVLAAARDVGFRLAIGVLPFRSMRKG
jgi:hypothetical protein